MRDDFIEGAEGPDEFDPEVIANAQSEAARAKDKTDAAEDAKLRRVEEAYRRVFSEGKPIDGDVDVLMMDLASFCRGYSSTYHTDSREHARLEGRREAFMRIMDFTRLDHDTLMRMYLSAATQL
jgi:hypothetical protein